MSALLTGVAFAVIGLVSLVFPFRIPPWAFLIVAIGFALWAFYRAFHEVRLERDELRGLKDAVVIETRPSARWGDSSRYVQHIHVWNLGNRNIFSAAIDSNFKGLEVEYGIGNELVWEHPQAAEKALGRDQVGVLRLLASERGNDGFVRVWFFAVPEFRHGEEPGYLETQAYRVLANDSLAFELCVRNVEKDIAYRRTARIAFASDGKPELEMPETGESFGT